MYYRQISVVSHPVRPRNLVDASDRLVGIPLEKDDYSRFEVHEIRPLAVDHL